MPAPLVVPMTPNVIAAGNYTVRVTAISPVDGSVVAGVKVSLTAILGHDLSGQASGDSLAAPLPLLVPADDSL